MDGSIDWDALLVPSMHVGEIILRGTAVYLFLFFLLRVLRREAGHIGISDIVVVVLIADAAQNAMASEYKSLTEGAILVATIASCSWTGSASKCLPCAGCFARLP